jgi:hypothetical protein
MLSLTRTGVPPGSSRKSSREKGTKMSYPLLDAFLTMMWFFLWLLWLYLLFWIIWDVLRSPDLSGWLKAGWVALTVLLPFVGVLLYLIARGGTMHERRARDARHEAYRSSARDVPPNGGASASEIGKLADLRARDLITEDEFQQGKARILS